MTNSSVLWQNWQTQVEELLTGLHGHQKKTLALFVLGIVLSGSAVLQRVAEVLQQHGISQAKMTSIERRLARFVANERIVVAFVWKQFLAQVLPYFQGQKLRFVLDATPFQQEMTIVYLGLLVHWRVLPVAWKVMPATTKWEERQWAIVAQLLDLVTAFLPQTHCTLLADAGLAGYPLVKLCQERGWHYLLRIGREHTCRRWMRGKLQPQWQRFAQFVLKPGYHWYGKARVWQEHTIEAFVSIAWEPDFEDPWILISDEAAGWCKIQEYALRMRVEATFQDSKSRGFQLEASWIQERARLERLLLAVFLAIWWTSHLAAACIHNGQRSRFDRTDRRDKSIFRLGRLWLLDILRRACNRAALRCCLPFQQTPHGWRFALRF
jgi:Transposase DDE domain